MQFYGHLYKYPIDEKVTNLKENISGRIKKVTLVP